MHWQVRSDGYRYGFGSHEKDDEVKGEGNHLSFGDYGYDTRLGRRWNIDPLISQFPEQSSYSTFFNSPIRYADPTGLAPEDWVEKDGDVFYDNRATNQEDATSLYGEGSTYRANGYSYTSSDGSNIELGDYGFYKQNGIVKSSPDLAEKSLANTNPEQAMINAESQISDIRGNYTASAAVVGFIAADVAIPEPTDAALPKWVGYAVVGGIASYYVSKMEREIEGIKRRAGGPQGAQYSLQATSSGAYPCFTCADGKMNLNVGHVWKYGETINPSSRYTSSQLSSWGVSQVNEFYGNQVQIKVMEKTKIYSYFLLNGHLPPGNKIFR